MSVAFGVADHFRAFRLLSELTSLESKGVLGRVRGWNLAFGDLACRMNCLYLALSEDRYIMCEIVE
jgi:hypothetical protein